MIAPVAGQQAHIRECLWCQTVILATRRQRGSPPKFCSPSHRIAFWAALRRRALADFEAGVLTLEMLKGGERSVHALSGQAQTPSHVEGASS